MAIDDQTIAELFSKVCVDRLKVAARTDNRQEVYRLHDAADRSAMAAHYFRERQDEHTRQQTSIQVHLAACNQLRHGG